MRSLWKFEVPLESDGKVLIPGGHEAQIVGVGAQGLDAVLWASVDPGLPREERYICGVPTGAQVPDGWRHHGVVQRPDGIVIHVMERQ
jgi:hypothetical protein